jgi:hypothetical protein
VRGVRRVRGMGRFLKLEDVRILLGLGKRCSIVSWDRTGVISLRESIDTFRVWKFWLLKGERRRDRWLGWSRRWWLQWKRL